jgi:hypothetical protein
MLRPLLAAACALLVPAAAGAQAPAQPPIVESAADLAYGFCPLFLAGKFSLTGPELARHGFDPAVQTQQHPRYGEIRTVWATRGDGELSFGGVPGKVCNVVVLGPEREAALLRLREDLPFMGLPFVPTPHTGEQIEGAAVETFKAPVKGQFLYVQLIRTSAPLPALSVQLFATDK